MLLRCGALILLAVACYWSIRFAYADRLSRNASLAGRERAVRLAPAAAALYEKLAEKQTELGIDALHALSVAAKLSPANPEPLLRLGLSAELAGNYVLAERSYLQAAERSRLYQAQYCLSQFYFRRKNADEFFKWTRRAIEASYGDIRPLLVLEWNIRPDPVHLAALARTQRRQVERQVLRFLLQQGEGAAAASVAVHLAARSRDDDIEELLTFCDGMLNRGDPVPAQAVWNMLCRRRQLPFAVLIGPRSLVTNPGFHFPPSGRGFDWRVEPVAGVETRFANGEWRISFSGRQPEYCVIGWQYAPLEPGKKYRLQAEWTTIDTDSTAGLSSTILDGPIPKLILMYRRPPGTVRLSGSVAVRNLHLEQDE